MQNSVIHHKTTTMTNGGADLHGSANVCMFSDGSNIVTLGAAYGSATMQLHIDATSLRALAKLINEAVEKLPVQDRPIDLSSLHPVMADAVRPFIREA